MLLRFEDVFRRSAGVLLAITSIAKAYSALSPAALLDLAEPVLGMPFRYLMLFAGSVEMAVALLCLFTSRRKFSLLCLAWLGATFAAYRTSLWLTGWHRPCGCLGNLTDALHISADAADLVMKVALGYLILGSFGALLWRWKTTVVGGPSQTS